MHASIDQLWQRYRAIHPQAPEQTPIAYHFCDNAADAAICLALVLSGQKQATACSLAELELNGDPIPQVGDYAIVTNWEGEAQCVIQTHTVVIQKFADVDDAFVHAEGEGDKSLAWWRTAHQQYFTRVLAGTNYAVDDALEIACEQFKLVFRAD